MKVSAPIPVSVIGGYLGAGKTTLVNHLLRHAGGRRLAVLVNDFGELPIDDALIEARDGNLLRLAGGCVCCSFGSDLLGALQQLSALSPPPQQLLLECSGVARPGAVARTLTLLPALQRDAVLVLADAESLRERAADRYVGELVQQQLAEADLIALNKCDRIDAATLPALQAWLADAAPRARVLPCTQGRLPPELLFGTGTAPRAGTTGPAHDASQTFASVSFEFAHAVDAQRLAGALTDPALGLLRAKGLLRDAQGAWCVLQLVGSRCQVEALPGPPPALSRLVGIGLRARWDPAALRQRLEDCRA